MILICRAWTMALQDARINAVRLCYILNYLNFALPLKIQTGSCCKIHLSVFSLIWLTVTPLNSELENFIFMSKTAWDHILLFLNSLFPPQELSPGLRTFCRTPVPLPAFPPEEPWSSREIVLPLKNSPLRGGGSTFQKYSNFGGRVHRADHHWLVKYRHCGYFQLM